MNYPALFLNVDTARPTACAAQLVPDATGTGAKAYLQAPEHTPWRTVVVADNAPAILASKLILNLNEPSKLPDTGWIRPQKFVGVWWEMQTGRASWNYADSSNLKLAGTNWAGLQAQRPPRGHHRQRETLRRFCRRPPHSRGAGGGLERGLGRLD